MKIKEIIAQLISVEAKDYPKVRSEIGDDFITFVKNHMPSYYDLFKDKEEVYQSLLEFCKNFPIE